MSRFLWFSVYNIFKMYFSGGGIPIDLLPSNTIQLIFKSLQLTVHNTSVSFIYQGMDAT